MGVSTNAILAYGFDLGEDCPWPYNDDDEQEDWIGGLLGLKEPQEEFDKDNEEVMKKYNEYWDARRNALDELGVYIDIHCSCDCPMYAVIVTESEHHAHRGYPKKVDLMWWAGWDDKLRKFCKLTGIEYQKPSWMLYSLWC